MGPECSLGSHAVVCGAWLSDGGVMRICDMCHGKGKFGEHKAVLETPTGQKTVEIPERICTACDGKGYIATPQFEGYPPVIGCLMER